MISTYQNSAGNAACLASQRGGKSRVRQSTGLTQLQESAEKPAVGVQVRNTFIDGGLSRTPSFEDFFQERELLSCPSRHIGRINGFLKELDVGDEENSSSDGQTSTQTPSRGTPSHDTPSSSSCKNVHCDEADDYSAQPWYGLASPFETPLDSHSFSVASSLQNHVRMLEELAQSQEHAPLHAHVGHQPPPLIVHHLEPAVSQASQPEPVHQTRRTLLCLDVAIEEGAGSALFAHAPANAPANAPSVRSTCNDHQVFYSSGMAMQNQPASLCYPEVASQPMEETHVLQPATVGVHTLPTSHTVSSMEGVIEEHFAPNYNNHKGNIHWNALPVAASARFGGDPSSFASQVPSPPISTKPNGMPVVPPSVGYGIFAPGSHPIDVPSSTFQLAAPNLFGAEAVAHGNTLPSSCLESPIPAPPSGPALGSPELPSVGSAGHAAGRCKPCAFFYNRGCENGIVCEFCHMCEPGEKKRRQKEKISNRRTMKQTASVAN